MFAVAQQERTVALQSDSCDRCSMRGKPDTGHPDDAVCVHSNAIVPVNRTGIAGQQRYWLRYIKDKSTVLTFLSVGIPLSAMPERSERRTAVSRVDFISILPFEIVPA